MLIFTINAAAVVDVDAPDPTWADVDTANVPDRESNWNHATAAELRLAARAGVAAYDADAPAAPGADATILNLVGRDPLNAVGKPRTAQLFRAFSDAYQTECDKAAAAILDVCSATRSGDGYWTCDVPGGCPTCRTLAAEIDDLGAFA